VFRKGLGKIKRMYTGYASKTVTFDKVVHLNCDNKPVANPHKVDIVTVSFNNEQVITEQIRLLAKYLKDPYYYTVADNSSDQAKQEAIMRLCSKSGAGYIRLPKNPYSKKAPSSSHGFALNWAYRNYIKSRRAAFFGFIDHDIYPIQPTSVVESLERTPAFGLVQERKDAWYLWPGLCFFARDYVKDKKIDFMPGKYGDTGSENWESLYTGLDKTKVPQLCHEYGHLREGDNAQSDWFEYVGDWLHTFNASCWLEIEDKEGKDSLVAELLNKY